MMTPSAPTAMAARVSGGTRSRRPPEGDGSTRTGRGAQPLRAESLEGVGGGARLESAPAQEGRSRRLGHPCRLEGLLRRLDRAGPGDERHGAGADRYPADPDDRAVGVVLPADELV